MKRMGLLQFLFLLGLTILVVGLAVTLVNQRYEIRTLFVEHERAVDVGRRLSDDQADLLLRIRRAALPSNILQGADALGLDGAKSENTVSIVMDDNHRVTAVDFDVETHHSVDASTSDNAKSTHAKEVNP